METGENSVLGSQRSEVLRASEPDLSTRNHVEKILVFESASEASKILCR